MKKQELRLIALKIALDRGRTDGIDMVLEIAEKIYSYLIKEGVDNESSESDNNSIPAPQKVFR